MKNQTYKNRSMFIFLIVILMVSLFYGCQSNTLTPGENLYIQATRLENQRNFSDAKAKYNQALEVLIKEKKTEMSRKCGEAIQRITLFEEVYCYNIEQIEQLIRLTYPDASNEQIENWISSNELESYTWDNEEHYFGEAVANLQYRHMELMYANEASQQQYHDLILGINESALETPIYSWMPFQNPKTYRGKHKISIARNLLPDIGSYRLWFPLPINNGPQTNVTVDKVSPEKWLKYPPSFDQDIGMLYMEIPMKELKEDLLIEIEFSFTHYEQRFTVNPEHVGQYDKESELYKKYTKSSGNTEITVDIQKKAKDIVQGETNPYLAARKVYDYIVNNIDYSFMPHYVLWPRTSLTESKYVHMYKRGDCGAQSMYFSAMCRSLGIPARSTGGYQLFGGAFGTHFWAEFYLPNYGWIPVDTSCAQLALYPKDMSIQNRQIFIDYYFGNQDAMRCVVQKDTDIPLIPNAAGLVLLPMAVQTPMVEYSLPTSEVTELLFLSNWTLECEKIIN